MTNQSEKYAITSLYIPSEGIDSWMRTLNIRVSIALGLNRIPIITPFHSSPVHNFGLALNNCRWEKYIDLDKTEIYKRKESGILEKESFPLRWIASEDFNAVHYPQEEIGIIKQEQLYDKENEKYKILVLDGHFDHQPPFFVKFASSQAVNELTDVVLRRFGTSCAAMSSVQNLFNNRCDTAPLFEKIKREKCFYSCLHVRAGDSLLKLIHSFYSAQPKHIKKLVYSACPRGTKLYIMSDIHDPSYFDFLRDRYDVYTYHDFPELKQLINGENDSIDNNMLFMVEKNIMDHALVKITAQRRGIYHFQSDFAYDIPALALYVYTKIRNNPSVSPNNIKQIRRLALLYKIIYRMRRIIGR